MLCIIVTYCVLKREEKEKSGNFASMFVYNFIIK